MVSKILVTGGNTGIGFALCKQLAIDKGIHVLLAARSEEKGKAAVKAINELKADALVDFVHMVRKRANTRQVVTA